MKMTHARALKASAGVKTRGALPQLTLDVYRRAFFCGKTFPGSNLRDLCTSTGSPWYGGVKRLASPSWGVYDE